MAFPISLDQIKRTQDCTRRFFTRTSLTRAPKLESLLGANFEIHLKREDTQPTGAFKNRGAAALITSIIDKCGRDAIERFYLRSSGNHALGSAYVCQQLGIPLTAVVPDSIPEVKLKGIRDTFGAGIVQFSLDDTREGGYTPGDDELKELEGKGSFFLHPYAEAATMMGTAGIGLEIYEDLPDVTDVVGVVSGGGHFGGVCAGLKQIQPEVNMIAVEPVEANDFQQSLKQRRIVRLDRPRGIQDGLLSHDVGAMNWNILSQSILPTNALTVADEETWQAMQVLWDEMKIVAEPSGAASFAALLAGKVNPRGDKVVVIISGGNVDNQVFLDSLAKGSWQGTAH